MNRFIIWLLQIVVSLQKKPGVGCCSSWFSPGQELYPCQDIFIREYIQTKVAHLISPFQDWVICIFNFFNVILFVTVAQLCLWVGMWDLFSYYVWPYDNTSYRDLCYCVIGFLTMNLSIVFFSPEKSYEKMEDTWHETIPKSFGLRRKIKNYARENLNFIGFLFVWVGAWDFIDTKIYESTILREVIYFVIPWFVSFALEELFSPESIYYLVVSWKRRQRNLIQPEKE